MTTQESYHTIFQQDWWLDAVAPGQWDAVEVERGGTVQARLPFVIKRHDGVTTLGQAPLTQSLGPWVRPTGAGYSKTLSREMSLYRELIEGLPQHDRFSQRFAPQVTNWLPFYWEGFTQTTRYTYVISLDEKLDAIWQSVDKRTRNRISKASAKLEITAHESGGLETLLDMSEMTFERQGMAMPYSRDFVYRLDEAVQKNARRLVVISSDPATGEPHAANYTFGDKNRVYALISGANPELRGSGASEAARWEALKWAHSTSAVFDFEGSMLQGVEHRNRKYGAVQVPYFSIYRSNGKHEKQEARRRRLRAPLLKAYRTKEKLLKSFR